MTTTSLDEIIKWLVDKYQPMIPNEAIQKDVLSRCQMAGCTDEQIKAYTTAAIKRHKANQQEHLKKMMEKK